jgi:glycosyltransferase involved in cell wall biosynthesis
MTAPSGQAAEFVLCVPDADAHNVAGRMGRSDYSYLFVRSYFEPLVASIGRVESTTAVDPGGAPSALTMMFVPPHAMPETPNRPTLGVFAWEYDTIPFEAWADEPRNDWRLPLSWTRGAITHSSFAREAVVARMPADYPVASIPAPVWDRFHQLAAEEPHTDPWTLHLNTTWEFDRPAFDVVDTQVELSGVVYTLVANPDDGRKNWDDAFSAFVYAFRDNPDVTLVVKLIHFDASRAGDIVSDLFARGAPYQCRVVFVFGYLDGPEYESLIRGTTFAVNSSRGEGQCLPLMEFMSAGRPAIAPDHTAMAEYVDQDNSFVVESFTERTHWPHDPRLVMRCMTRTINWESLRAAYQRSWEVITTDPDRYRRMRRAASQALHGFCSEEVLEPRLREFVAALAAAEDPRD